MKCPCCNSKRRALVKVPEPHFFCAVCLHRSKIVSVHKRYYERLSGRSKMLEKVFKKKNAERIKFIRSYLRDRLHVLEFGCAEGSLGAAIKRNFNLNYSGVEISADGLIAKKRLDRVWQSLGKISPKESFDLVLAFHVFEHLHNIGNAVSQLHTLLSEQGIMVVEVPYYSGNKLLPWDCHREHLHSFSVASLSALLERNGFFIKEMHTGCYESGIYNDSIRVIVCKATGYRQRRDILVSRFHTLLGKKYAIYGVGGDFENLVSPYVKPGAVVAIVDGSLKNIGRKILGKAVQGPGSVAQYAKHKFLIATYRYQNEIVGLLNKEGVAHSRIITLSDIFEKREG